MTWFNGSSARSGILSREELHVVSAYVDTKIRQIGREILDGKIAANPYEKGNEEADGISWSGAGGTGRARRGT